MTKGPSAPQPPAAPGPQPVPAGLNGNTPPARQTADAVTLIAELLPKYGQAFGGILAGLPQAIGQAVRIPNHWCAQCVIARLTWEAAHQADLQTAAAVALHAAGVAEGQPVPPGFDPTPFLPPNLQPGGPQGMPPLNNSITTVNGTEVCAAHIPGQPGGRALLIAHGSLSSGLLAQFAA
jgi:hypothetical protein